MKRADLERHLRSRGALIATVLLLVAIVIGIVCSGLYLKNVKQEKERLILGIRPIYKKIERHVMDEKWSRALPLLPSNFSIGLPVLPIEGQSVRTTGLKTIGFYFDDWSTAGTHEEVNVDENGILT